MVMPTHEAAHVSGQTAAQQPSFGGTQLAQLINTAASSIGGVAHDQAQALYQKDVGERINRLSGEAAAVEMMGKFAKHKAWMRRMEEQSRYLGDVISLTSPEAIRDRAAGMRGYGDTARRMMAASKAAGGSQLRTARAISRGARGARVSRLQRAAREQGMKAAERGIEYARTEMDAAARARMADLVMSGYGDVMQTRARHTAAEASHAQDWRRILMGWTVPQ